MKRGDIVTMVASGDFGKPRPALIIQSDLFQDHTSVTLIPLTSALIAAPLLRVTVEPLPSNGLGKTSQLMIDKLITVKREKIGRCIGRLDSATLIEVNRRLAIFLGIV